MNEEEFLSKLFERENKRKEDLFIEVLIWHIIQLNLR